MERHGNDPAALDEKFSNEAQAACSIGADDYLRRSAQYGYKWSDSATGMLGTKFDKFSPRSTGQGMLTLISTQVSFGNEYGAFSPSQVYCLYNAENDEVARFSRIDPAIEVGNLAKDQ